MKAVIRGGKYIKGFADVFPGPFPPDAEVVWLPDSFLSMMDGKLNPDFVYPDDPRLSMTAEELSIVSAKTAEINKPVKSIAELTTEVEALKAEVAKIKDVLKIK